MGFAAALMRSIPGQIAARAAGRVGQMMEQDRLREDQARQRENEYRRQYIRNLSQMDFQQQQRQDAADRTFNRDLAARSTDPQAMVKYGVPESVATNTADQNRRNQQRQLERDESRREAEAQRERSGELEEQIDRYRSVAIQLRNNTAEQLQKGNLKGAKRALDQLKPYANIDGQISQLYVDLLDDLTKAEERQKKEAKAERDKEKAERDEVVIAGAKQRYQAQMARWQAKGEEMPPELARGWLTTLEDDYDLESSPTWQNSSFRKELTDYIHYVSNLGRRSRDGRAPVQGSRRGAEAIRADSLAAAQGRMLPSEQIGGPLTRKFTGQQNFSPQGRTTILPADATDRYRMIHGDSTAASPGAEPTFSTAFTAQTPEGVDRQKWVILKKRYPNASDEDLLQAYRRTFER